MGASNDNVGFDMQYNHTSGAMKWSIAGSDEALTATGARWAIRDTTNANQNIGLTINQEANDNEILAFKSSEVAHGLVSVMETDTYGTVDKYSGDYGGLRLTGVTESNGVAAVIQGYNSNTGGLDATPGTGTGGPVQMRAFHHDGSNSRVNSPSNALIFTVGCYNTAGSYANVFHIDEDGDIAVDGSSTVGTFDDQIDYQLVRSARQALTPDLFHSGTNEMIAQHGDLLEENRIVFRNKDTDGVPFVNLKRGLFLAWDGIYQTGKKVYEDLSPAVDEMRSEIAELKQSLKLLQEAN